MTIQFNNSTDTISSTTTDGNLVLNPDGTGSVDVSSAKIINVATPTSDNDATNKTYVDSLISGGVHFHQPVRVESPINLTATYNNGSSGVGATLTNSGTQVALVIDGITLSVNDRVLVYQQSNQTENGVYVVTDVGSVSTNWVLTRSSDADTYVFDSPLGLSEGSTFFVQQGDTGAGEIYTCNTPGTITFGTTNITFVQVGSAAIYTAGAGLDLTGTQFSVETNGITDAMLRQSAGLSVIGRSANTTGDVADITAASDHQVLRRSGTSIGFGAVALDQTNAVTGTLPVANGGTGASTLTADNVILGDGTNAVKFVAPGANGNVLTSDGTTWTSAAAGGGGFAAGTRMIFAQTTAPTGWTKDTVNYDNHALRVVTGTASTGGSVDFTTAFASQTPTGNVSVSASTGNTTATNQAFTPSGNVSVSASVGNTILSTPQIPSHLHPVPSNDGNFPGGTANPAKRANNAPISSFSSGNQGGGGAHNHPISAPASFTGSPVTIVQNAHNHPVSAPATFTGSAINLAVKYLDVITATKD